MISAAWVGALVCLYLDGERIACASAERVRLGDRVAADVRGAHVEAWARRDEAGDFRLVIHSWRLWR